MHGLSAQPGDAAVGAGHAGERVGERLQRQAHRPVRADEQCPDLQVEQARPAPAAAVQLGLPAAAVTVDVERDPAAGAAGGGAVGVPAGQDAVVAAAGAAAPGALGRDVAVLADDPVGPPGGGLVGLRQRAQGE